MAAKSKPKTKALKTVEVENALTAPDFMKGSVAGTEDLGQYVILPRIKVIQPMAGAEYDDFNSGDAVVTPINLLLAEMPYVGTKSTNEGEIFHFVPLFFFAEWCTWNDILMKGDAPAILERTCNPAHPLVAKSRSPQLWEEDHPEGIIKEGKKMRVRHVEHLNYAVAIVGDNELAGTTMVMSFFRGEHKQGSKLAMLAKLRKAPLWGCQFQAQVHFRTNNKGQWFGIDVSNPEESTGVTPFVTDEKAFRAFETINQELREAHEAANLMVDYGDEVEGETADSKGEF